MNILIVSQIDPDAIRQLETWHDVRCALKVGNGELPSLVHDRDVLIFRSGVQISAELMQSAPQLKFLVRAGSGYDNVDLDYARAHGIHFVRIPEPGAKAVAELSFGLMLALARNVRSADRKLRQGHWTKNELTRCSYLLTGKVLGIVGAGNIGSRVGRLGAAWDMDAIGCVAHPSPAVKVALSKKNIRLRDFNEVLSESDFVSVHVPLQESTRNLIDSAALAAMKPGAFLINLARGGVVDEQALYAALTQGHLRGAALDVHQHEGEGKISPLAGLDNVVLTPHIGASTVDSQREIGQRVISLVNTFYTEAHEAQTSAINI